MTPEDLERYENQTREIGAVFSAVFNNQSGHLAMEKLQLLFGDKTSHTPGDPYTTAFKEGQRSVLLKIISYMSAYQKSPK